MVDSIEIVTPVYHGERVEHATPLVEHRPLWKDIISEFVGTFLFVYISLAGVNQVILTSSGIVSQLHIALCFGLGLSSGIIVAGKSGGHLNPAVSFTTYLTNDAFNFKRFIGYAAAQTCGAFVAGLLVLAVYYSWIDKLPNPETWGSFGTLKNSNNSLFASILDQFIGSALLMFGIIVTPDSWSKPITIGSVLAGIGLFQGTNGFGINPARDFGPRVASSIVFNSYVFTAEESWFWVPLVVPFFGMIFGSAAAKYLSKIN